MRRALIVGIDAYPTAPLFGCVEDATRMEAVLSANFDGSPNFDCRVVKCPQDKVARPTLKKAIVELFRQPADIVWLHYSGHGIMNQLGGYLVTPDATEFDEGVAMSDILTIANDSPVADKIITLDCCDSGAFGTLPTQTADSVCDGLAVISATRAHQESLEVGGGGVFTSLLVEALEGGAAGILGEITTASIYASIESALGAWDQRPMFKANVSRFVRVREAGPRVPRELLRRIKTHFPLPAEELRLSPAYEPTLPPDDLEKQNVFADLQRLRTAGLVEPVTEEHMYYVALNSGLCQLTPLGRYYWRLVDNNRI